MTRELSPTTASRLERWLHGSRTHSMTTLDDLPMHHASTYDDHRSPLGFWTTRPRPRGAGLTAFVHSVRLSRTDTHAKSAGQSDLRRARDHCASDRHGFEVTQTLAA